MIIQLPTGFYEGNDKIFKAKSVDLQKGFSVLVGCNGTGKTTFFKHLENECKNNDYPFFSYDNLNDGGSTARSKMAFKNNLVGLFRDMSSSEGENIYNNVSEIAEEFGSFIRRNKAKKKPLFVVFDAVDSGLSIDNIVELKNFFKFVMKHESDAELYLIVSANSYEMASGEQCVDITNGKYITFNSYDEYREFVLNSRKIKDARYAKESKKKGKRRV